MKLQKEFNEYGDKLVSLETAINAEAAGFDIHQVECFTITEGVPKEKALIFDEWYGLISDGQKFLCFRPTITYLQKWLRDKHNIHVYIGYRMNIKKWDWDAYDMNMGAKEYVKTRTMQKFKDKELYDTYDEALEKGVDEAIQLLLHRE